MAASGRIAPAGGIIRVGAPAGISGQPIVAELNVKVGDWVEAGQLLATLRDRPLLEAQVRAAERDRDAANAAVTQAMNGQIQALAEFHSQLADLEVRAIVAEANAHRAAEGSRLELELAQRQEAAAKTAYETALRSEPVVLAAAGSGVPVAQAQVDAVPRTRDSERKIANAGLEQAKAGQQRANTEIAAQLEQLKAQAELAALRVKAAEAALVIEPTPDHPAKLAPVQLEAIGARALFVAQQKLLPSIETSRAGDVAAAQAKAAAAEAQVAVARAQLSLSEIRAPSPGKILAIRAKPGEIVGLAGVLELGDTREIFVDALVYIDDVPGVRVGQKTIVTGYALPSTGLLGKVTEISPVVTGNSLPSLDPTEFSDQAVVVVKVRLDEPAPAVNFINGQVKVRFEP